MYSIHIKGSGKVIIERGQSKGQPRSEGYHPELVKGKAFVYKVLKYNH